MGAPTRLEVRRQTVRNMRMSVVPGSSSDGTESAPGVSLDGSLRKKLSEAALHLYVEEDIRRWLVKAGLTLNAVGEWTHLDGRRAGVHSRILATEYANHFRRTHQYITVGYCQEIVEEIERGVTEARREDLIVDVLSMRGAPDDELVAWVVAVTGGNNPLHVAIVKHWLWMVKRAAARKSIDHNLMPVLFGVQGSGKSTAARRLCGPLKELALIPASGEMLTDSRWAPMLGRYLVGVWDEMEGADKASIEAIKRTITAGTAAYRPMGTNSASVVDVTTQWLGTSNRSIASMIRDATGNRRFVEIPTLARCNWTAIDALDYSLVWGCVDHEAESPLLTHLPALRLVQCGAAYRDSVMSWLDEESWGGYEDEGYQHAPRTDFTAIPAREVRTRYFLYCDRERPREAMSSEMLGLRLHELGWTKSRNRIGASRTISYSPPADYRKNDE